MYFAAITDAHMEELARLYVETFNAPPWNDAWTPALAAKRLEQMQHCAEFFGLVAVAQAGEIVGAALGNRETYFSGDHFQIKEFFVAPHAQAKGAGTRLLSEMETQLKAQGVAELYLFTARTNAAAEFYQNRGFAQWDGMVMMGKAL